MQLYADINEFVIQSVSEKTKQTGWVIADESEIKAGFGVNSDGLRLLTVARNGEHRKVCIKTFKAATETPREVLFFEEISNWGECKPYFPQYYGSSKIDDQYSILLEYVERSQSNRHRGELRPKALARLSGLYYHADASGLISVLKQHPPKLRNMLSREDARRRVVENISDGEAVLDALDALAEHVEKSKKSGALIPAFAHGDAQLPNLLIDASGNLKIIDIGTMRLAPAGYDIAKLCFSKNIKHLSHERFAKSLCDNVGVYLDEFKKTMPSVGRESIYIGALLGMRDIILRKLYRLSVLENELAVKRPEWQEVQGRQLEQIRMLTTAYRDSLA